MNERRLCLEYPQLAALSEKQRKALLHRVPSRVFRDWRFWLLFVVGPAPLLLTALCMAAVVVKQLPWDDALPSDAGWWVRFTAILAPMLAASAGWMYVLLWHDRRLARAAVVAELAALEQAGAASVT